MDQLPLIVVSFAFPALFFVSLSFFRDHQRRVRRLLYCRVPHWRSRSRRRVDAAGGARPRREDDADEVLGRVAVGHNLRHLRRRQGARREPHRKGESGIQVHHVRAPHAYICSFNNERRGRDR